MTDRSDDPLYKKPPVRPGRPVQLAMPTQWPKAAIDLNKRTVEQHVATCTAAVADKPDPWVRIRAALETVERAAEELVPRADAFLQAASGEEKKALVLEWLKLLVGRLKKEIRLPWWARPVWLGVEWGLGKLVDTVHARLEAAGKL